MKKVQAGEGKQDDTLLRRGALIASVWESFGLWLVSLMMGLIVVQIFLSAGHDTTQQAWQDDRVSMILGDLAGQLETDLALGIDPTTNGQAQRALNEAYRHHPMLYRIALVNTEGRVVADSDRANIGAHIPAHVINATVSLSGAVPLGAEGARAWKTWANDQRVHSIVVRNAFGATVGYVMIGLPGDTKAALQWRVVLLWGIAALCVFCTAWVLALLMLRRHWQRQEGPLTQAYDQACMMADARLVQLEAALVSLRRNADLP